MTITVSTPSAKAKIIWRCLCVRLLNMVGLLIASGDHEGASKGERPQWVESRHWPAAWYEREMVENTIQITPFMHVADVGAAVSFFVKVLGFTAPINGERYAYVEREGAGIRIQWHDDPCELGAPHGGFAYYIDVRDLSLVQEAIGPGLATLPDGHVHGPIDQPYGQRELLIRAPDGNLIVFGQAVTGP